MGPWLPPLSVHVICTLSGCNAVLCSGTTPPPSPAKYVAAEFMKKAQNAQSSTKSVAGSGCLPAPIPISVTQLAALQERALSEGNMSAILDLAATLTGLLKWAPTFLLPSVKLKKKLVKKAQH